MFSNTRPGSLAAVECTGRADRECSVNGRAWARDDDSVGAQATSAGYAVTGTTGAVVAS